MIDKGKYASHGAYIKRIPQAALAQREKPKLAVIHPLPTTVPRTPQIEHQLQGVTLNSKTLSTKFRFQDNIDRKPVSQQFVTPFLYIEKVIKKQTVDQKLSGIKHLEPFITSKNMKARKTKNQKPSKVNEPLPQGFKNLYDYEQERRKIAKKLFQKMLEADVHNLKDMFLLWTGKTKKYNPQIDIKEADFVQFIREILPSKVSEKLIKHFFELYKNKTPPGKDKEEQFRSISVKALSFNYQKYRKSQTEVANIMSEKSVKQRYISVKNYLIEFDANYHSLKQSMNSIKNYQESLKNHFKQLFQSYRNPFQGQIEQLQRELQKPIIKYDKFKKNELTGKIQQLTAKNEEMQSKMKVDFDSFMQNYEQAILPNHDLFFTKRTICKLLLPLLNSYPLLTKELIQEQVEQQQQQKQQYLQCLSDLVVQIDKDKKHLGEQYFTLDEIVQAILLKNRKNASTAAYSDDFQMYSVKKLIKQIKKQFLIKFSLSVQSFDEFPADQQIQLELLHLCFQMECTKVLLKNQIWQQLLNLIPSQSEYTSKLHQRTIDANTCLEFVRRYFTKLDERMKVELNKSKQISLMAENVNLDQFQLCGDVIRGVLHRIDDYVEDQEEMADKVQPLTDKKRVTFGDIVDQAVERSNFPQKYNEETLQKERENIIVKSLIKSIFQADEPRQAQRSMLVPGQRKGTQFKQQSMVQNLQSMNTLAKSFYVPQGLNTNSFDIRYYQKQKQKLEGQPKETEVVRMGSSILLSNLPHVEDIKSQDPLRISRFLMNNIDTGIKETQKVVRERENDSNIREGVSHNYYKDKIKLENKPTVYDSEGKSKYSVLLPVGYYQSFVAAENVPDEQKWYLRPHHVETLTENPLSKKDNIIHTEYQSKLDKIPLKKRPDEFVIEQNVKRKSQLIDSLQQRISALKRNLSTAQRGSQNEGATVPTTVVNNYLSKLTEHKEDKELELASYEGILYDLRRKERELLNSYRNQETAMQGQPSEKWWQRKDKLFNVQLHKDRLLVADSLQQQPKHRLYVQQLKNSEIY